MRYKDASAALLWLQDAFGFKEHLVVPGDNGMIAHAQLTFGNGMIMLGSIRDNEFDELQKLPDILDGFVSQSPYIIVEEIDQHYGRAVAAGAEIVIPLKDQDFPDRMYSCKDLEGHLWNFGLYDPWQVQDQ